MQVDVVGSVNVDLVLRVDDLPGPGETVMAVNFARMPGGKGANQAAAAARMGAATRLLGAVGDDEAGVWMREQLAQAGVDMTAVVTQPGLPTGAAHIAVDARGENQIIVLPGANHALGPVTPLPGARVVLAQNEVPVESIASAFAGTDGLRLLNAAPAEPTALAIFGLVDVLIVNEHELARYAALAGVTGADEAALAHALLMRGEGAPRQAVVVTLGARGCIAVWRERHVAVPAFPVVPLDTIGAGDCFCGALAALLAEGFDLASALPMANAAAALCTQTHGAVPAMPTRAAVEAFLAASKA